MEPKIYKIAFLWITYLEKKVHILEGLEFSN